MSCDRRCFDQESEWHDHDECSTCPGRDDKQSYKTETVTLVGIRADGTEEVVGTATMPPKMKAREIVREMFGRIDEDGCNDAASAYYCCEQLIEWMGKNQPRIYTARQPLTDEQINELRKAHLRVSELDGHSIHGQWEFARAIEAAHEIK